MTATIPHGDALIDALTIFALAIIVGYYVIWGVTPALHSPLMAMTNGISSVIIVGAIIAAGPYDPFSGSHSAIDATMPRVGLLAIVLASINIFGGFIVTWRMLAMFRKKSVPEGTDKKDKSS
ncbi:MAG: NAD(P) transhydrogenase subunit alpha [Alphaproteobacteria bacterium GM202ARS2]|nr:NAD(P) transhydrogenase subunit alpha [Alphaproteobacteria bacterium GM202ARS2]